METGPFWPPGGVTGGRCRRGKGRGPGERRVEPGGNIAAATPSAPLSPAFATWRDGSGTTPE